MKSKNLVTFEVLRNKYHLIKSQLNITKQIIVSLFACLFVKGCVRYLNRCTASPVYIYQLNGKEMSLQSLIISSLTLNIAIFKKGACQQPRPFYILRCVYKMYNGKIEASQLSNCDVLECPNESRLKNQIKSDQCFALFRSL